eukprot:CAMPEP_0206535522 /NCGR_PEP_ID=MMETSP0325_2-20121206/6187_1 /ASSEMBLY_ACC=CAM_ASM_000347 /TAXON_ID=2866 /ORGANISM="Crypthecodinium cohnii, Strain Seligo" /LENGTH=38 /DNA_ID= /DNA_START= /DNA_END= /DNA_ORIENTATION=
MKATKLSGFMAPLQHRAAPYPTKHACTKQDMRKVAMTM